LVMHGGDDDGDDDNGDVGIHACFTMLIAIFLLSIVTANCITISVQIIRNDLAQDTAVVERTNNIYIIRPSW